MAIEGLYYKQSGRFKPYAPVVLFGGCGLCSIVVGIVYGIADLYSPIVYLNVILPPLLGLGVGACIGRVAIWTHTRSKMLLIAAVLFNSMLLDYAAFVSWIFALSNWHVLIVRPSDMAYVLGQLAIDGAWDLSGVEFKGWALYMVWIVEVGTIIVAAVFLSYRKMKPMVYCEQCGAWVTGCKSVLPFEPIAKIKEFRMRLEEGDFSVLGSLTAVTYDSPQYTSYDLSHCTRCQDLHLLSIETVKLIVDNEGKVQAEKTIVIQNMLIDAESHELIQQLEPPEYIKEGAANASELDETGIDEDAYGDNGDQPAIS